MTREEYREQMKARANRKAITQEEFDAMPTSKQLAYAMKQKKLGLPVTQEENSYYDEAEYKSRYNKKDIVNGATEKASGVLDFVALAAKLDLLFSFVGK